MHRQVLDFLAATKKQKPTAFVAGEEGLTVLECGSYDVNGSPRSLFEGDMEYIGIDHRPGPGVDVVSLVHEYTDKPDGYFDTVVSTEMLEHDPHWRLSLTRMVELLKPGGSMILTMAAPGRPVHEVDCAPVKGHYQNMEADEVIDHVKQVAGFHNVVSDRNGRPNDWYLFFDGKA